MNVACKICGQENISERHFSAKHGITQKEYYQRYFPKRDLFDNTPIEYLNKDQYFSHFFNSRVNMARWMRENKFEKAEKIMAEMFSQWIEQKEATFVPCEIELKTSSYLPTTTIVNKIFGNQFYLFFEKNFPQLKQRFVLDYPKHKLLESSIKEKDITIAIDTREQKPLSFKHDILTKLDYGDYTAIGDDFYNIFIDRKSPNDFIGTFTQGLKRFEQELARAKKFNAYIIVMIEKPYTIMRNFQKTYLARFTRATPEYVFHNINDLLQRYDNFQLLFVQDRAEMRHYILKLLSYGEEIKNIDLQYFYDNLLI